MSEKIRERLGVRVSSTLYKEYIEDERKALEKSGGKDHDDKQFPHAACIIDVTRCSVAFANADDLMEGFERVMDGACQREFGCRSLSCPFRSGTVATPKILMLPAIVGVKPWCRKCEGSTLTVKIRF